MYDQENQHKKPQERQQINHLMILFCCTIFTIVLIGESILLKWETGAVVLHPVKRTEKKYKILAVSSERCWPFSYAAIANWYFSMGVRTPRLRCTRRVL